MTWADIALAENTSIEEYESWPDDGQYVVMPDMDGDLIPFEIIEAEADTKTKQVRCVHLSDELKTSEIRDYFELSASATTALTLAVDGTRWEVGTVDSFNARNFNLLYKTPMEALDWIADNYGGRLKFRVTIDDTGFTHFYVDLLTPVNTLSGVRAEFGRNLENISISVDRSRLYTKVIGLGQAEDVNLDTDVADPLTFESLTGNKFVTDENSRLLYGRYVDGTRQHIEGIYESQAQTKEGLLQETIRYLSTVNHPRINIEAKIVDLEQATVTDIDGNAVQLTHEKVRLHDSLYVIARDKGVLAEVEAVVYRIVRPLKHPGQTELELGDYKLLSTNTIRAIEQQTSELQLRRAVHNRGALFEQTETEYYRLDKVLLGTDAIFSGSLTAATGTFTGTLDAVDGTFTGTLSAVDGTFTGDLSANQMTAGKLESVDEKTYFDLDTAEIKLSTAFGLDDVVVTMNPTDPFKVTFDGDTVAEITSDGYFATTRLFDPASPDNFIQLVPDTTYTSQVDFVKVISGSEHKYLKFYGNLTVGYIDSDSTITSMQNGDSRSVFSDGAFCWMELGDRRLGIDGTGFYKSTDGGTTKTYF